MTNALAMVLPALLLSLACLSGCGKTGLDPDDPWNELTGTKPVRFASTLSERQSATKADLPAGTSFGVYAFYQEGDVDAGTGARWDDAQGPYSPDFMFNQEVEFDGTDYTYTPLRYWPSNVENTISFWAYYPYSASPVLYAGGTTNAYSASSTGIPDARYTTDGTTDFMTTELARDYVYGTAAGTDPNVAVDGIVPMDFHHRLASVEFKAKAAAEYNDPGYEQTLYIQKIEVINTYNTGTYSASGGWGSLSDEDGTTGFTSFSGESALTTTAQSYGTALLLMPQHLRHNGSGESGQDVSVRVTYKQQSSVISSVRTKVVSLHIPSDIESWAENQKYCYTLTISAGDGISLKVEVQNWEYWIGTSSYKNNVTVTERLTWDPDTFVAPTDPSLNNCTLLQDFTTGTPPDQSTDNYKVVVMKPGTSLTGTFTFDTPYHGTWVAMLETIGGSTDGSIVFSNDLVQIDGEVNGQVTIRIKAASASVTSNQYARLRFMCRTEGGQVLAVQDATMDADGKPYVIAQYVY